MRKLIVAEFITLDGVIQAPGARKKIPKAAFSIAAGRDRTGTMTLARTSLRSYRRPTRCCWDARRGKSTAARLSRWSMIHSAIP